MALSCLCTILENNKSFQFFVEWNSKMSAVNATQLLIRLYKGEDKRFGVNIANGVLQDIIRPLLPKTSFLARKYAEGDMTETIGQSPTAEEHMDESEMSQNAKDSVYSGDKLNRDAPSTQKEMNALNSIRSKVATRLRHAVIAANVIDAKKNKKDESYITQLLLDNVKQYDLRMVIFGAFYRVGFDLHELNFEEKQYMEAIQLYPYFKNGEIWSDIREELEDMNLKPVSDDDHWMETVIEET